MHNCRKTREALIEMALEQDGLPPAAVEHCPACSHEYASLRNALRRADQAMQATMPSEDFWSDYDAELQDRLESIRERVPPPQRKPDIPLLVAFRRLAFTSIRLPVPLAAALLIFAGLSVAFAFHSRAANPPAVITKTIEVPVVQEKIVTQTVYRERTVRRPTHPTPTLPADRKSSGTLASLAGFKPTNDVNLTIIKGSDRDEK